MSDRRPLKTRSQPWAQYLATTLASRRVPPNAISIAGIVISMVGATVLGTGASHGMPIPMVLLVAAGCVQARLLCNMMDGLVAVEGGLKSKSGDLFNELPDRIEDTAFLVGAGHAVGQVELGWMCAALALLTAYIRALGASLGQGNDFSGPSAKPHRMFLLTVGCLGGIIFHPVLLWIMWLICFATAITVLRRTMRLYRRLT